jgi:hypothetical protein
MLCRKLSSQVVRIISFKNQDVITLTLPDFDRQRQDLSALLERLAVRT